MHVVSRPLAAGIAAAAARVSADQSKHEITTTLAERSERALISSRAGHCSTYTLQLDHPRCAVLPPLDRPSTIGTYDEPIGR